MAGFGAILGGITGLFNSIFGGIDSISTSDEERLEWKTKMMGLQGDILGSVFELEKMYLKAQQNVLVAELQHGNFLTRSWRPLTMLIFVGFVVWFGIGTAFSIPVPSVPFMDNMMGLVKLGLGGYIVGRSGEKIAVNVVTALKKKEGI